MKWIKNKKAFTLIELIVVIAILAILTALAIPLFKGLVDHAKEKVCIANRYAIIREWRYMNGTDPSLSLQQHFDSNYEDKKDRLCPSEGIYTIDNDAISCKIHADKPDIDGGNNGGGTIDPPPTFEKGTITISDGNNSFIIKAQSTWESILQAMNGGGGVNIPVGSTIYEDGTLAMVISYSNWYPLTGKDMTLSEFIDKYPNDVITINPSVSKIWTDDDLEHPYGNDKKALPYNVPKGSFYSTGEHLFVAAGEIEKHNYPSGSQGVGHWKLVQ